MKKILAAVLSAAMCLSALTVNAVSAIKTDAPSGIVSELKTDDSGPCGESATWTFSNGTLTVTGTGKMTNWQMVENVRWSKYMSQIRNVVIGEGITSVGARAFYNARNLTSVQLPSTLTVIATASFEQTGLSSVTVPASVTTI